MTNSLDVRDLQRIKEALIGRRHAFERIQQETFHDKALLASLNEHLKHVDEVYHKVSVLEAVLLAEASHE
jgi:hypothetical protein